jgi:transposase
MKALYLRRQRGATREISRLCGISKASFHGHLKAYVRGGIEQLQHLEHDRPPSELAKHRPALEASVQQPPPTTVAEAAAKIAKLPGIGRQPIQMRQCVHALVLQWQLSW